MNSLYFERRPVATLKDPKASLVASLLLVAISFSDVTFNLFGGAESSAFPLIILLTHYLVTLRVERNIFIGCLGLSALALISMIYGVRLQTIAVSFATYMQLILVYFYFKKNGIGFSIVLCRWIVLIHLAVGVMQYAGVFGIILEVPLSLMLERASVTALVDIGRGVTFITTEPAHALQSIIFPIFILALSPFKIDVVFALVAIIVTVILSSAGVTAIYAMVMILVVVILRPAYIFPLSGLVAISLFFVTGRAMEAIAFIFQFLFSDDSKSLLAALELSGFRFPSVIAPLFSLAAWPSAFGLGAWELNILSSLYSAGFDVENLGHWRFTGELHPVKPYSVLGNLVSDFWWFGALLFVLLFIHAAKIGFASTLLRRKSALAIGIYFLALFAVTFLVTLGKPAFVAILGVVAHYHFINKEDFVK